MAFSVPASLLKRFASARYAVAVLAVAASAGFRLALEPILGNNTPFLTFFAAVLVARRLAGRGPALAATFLSGASVWYLFLEPRFSFRLDNAISLVEMGVFVLIASGISLFEAPRPPATWGESGGRLETGYAGLADKSHLRRLTMLAGATLALGILASVLWSGLQRTRDAETWVQHTYQVLNQVESMRSALETAETSQRGYLLTSNEAYLAEYWSAGEDGRRALATLRRLTADNVAQQARLDELESLARAQYDHLDKAIQTYQRKGPEAAVDLLRMAGSKEVMDPLRTKLDGVEAEERQLLHRRTTDASAADSRTRWILGLGSGSLILMLLLAGYSLERNIHDLKAAESLLASQSRLIDLSHDAIITMDGARRIMGWNSGAREMYGWTAEEAAGKVIHQFLHTESGISVREIDRKLLTQESWDGELSHRRSDGRQIVTESRHVVRRDGSGRPIGYLEINRDISERKRAEEALRLSEEKFAKAFATNPAAVAITRVEDGMFLEVNESWEAIFGYTREEVVGRLASEFGMWPATEDRERWAKELAEKGTIQGWEQSFFSKSGTAVPTLFSAAIVDVAGEPLALSTLIDIRKRKRAEEALRENESLLRSLFDSPGVMRGILEADDHSIVHISCNAAAADLYGLTQRDIAGKTPQQMGVSQGDLQSYLTFYQECRRTGKPLSGEFRRRDAQSKDRWLFVTVSLLGEGAGGRARFGYTALDVTARREAEEALRESESQFRTLANAIPQLCWVADSDGWIFWYNERWYQYTGTTPEQMEGWGWQSVHDQEALPQVLERWKESIASGKLFDMTFPLKGADGVFRPFLTRVMPIRDGEGKVVRWFGTNTDISEQQKAEAAVRESEQRVRQLNAGLEDRVRERTAQLEASNKELEAFSYSVSHDLRAPLRGIDGWSLALMEDYGAQLEPRALQYLSRVRSESQRMGRLIDDLLQLSRITRTEMHWEPVDLTGLAETIAARLREARPRADLEIDIQPGLAAFGDARLLQVALTNLLDNALKFTGRTAHARIELKKVEHEGQPAFLVSDNGAGFDMAYAGSLFGAFQRLHSDAEFPGTGIGLATVQRVIHRHGGRIWAQSAPDLGASFYFTVGGEV